MKTTAHCLLQKTLRTFYPNQCPKIFPQKWWWSFPGMFGPKYSGEPLHNIIKTELGDTKMKQTLTNLVIPTFDIKRLQPTIFSTYDVKKNTSLDAPLSDICISTSAAPTYLPAYYFETKTPQGKVREFNLIDGGVAANNPTLLAIGEVTKEIIGGSSHFESIKPLDYTRFLVISLGTGAPKNSEKYNSHDAAKWGMMGWLKKDGGTPLIDIFNQSSADMVDIHISALFRAIKHERSYLRIQDDTLTGNLSSVDIATERNLRDLVKVGENLLKKPVSRVNLDTGLCEPTKEGTNEEGLTRFARELIKEKQLRHARSPLGHATSK